MNEINPEEEKNEINETSRVVDYFDNTERSAAPKINEELVLFYELTKVDEELSEIDDEKGDLPDKITGQRELKAKYEAEIKDYTSRLNKIEKEINTLNAENASAESRIKKYDEEKYSAKNNKEYDSITKTIDQQYEVVEKNEKRLKEITEVESVLAEKRESAQEKLDEITKELEENESTLKELDEQYKQEEQELNNKKSGLLDKLNDQHRQLYLKINKTYKGEAVGLVRNGNCSGCYNSIPPQREIEIRAAEKIFTCQACGRILIDETLISNANR